MSHAGSDVFKALLKKIIVGEEGKKKLDDKIVDAATAAAASVVSYVAAFLFLFVEPHFVLYVEFCCG